MRFHCIAALVIATAIAAPHARAVTLGEAVGSDLGPKSFGALNEAPPEMLSRLHHLSSVLAARHQGILPREDAVAHLTAGTEALARIQPDLASLAPEAYASITYLQARVVLEELRDVLLTGGGDVDPDLLLAVEKLVQAIAETAEVQQDPDRDHGDGSEGPDAPPAGPRSDCFQRFAGCMQFCSELDGWAFRIVCALDCEMDLADCLRNVVWDGDRAPIEREGGINPSF